MSYEIKIGNSKYIGLTEPKSLEIKIYSSNKQNYIATFIPRTNSENKIKSGSWQIGSYFDGLETIDQLEPELIKFCEQRRQGSNELGHN